MRITAVSATFYIVVVIAGVPLLSPFVEFLPLKALELVLREPRPIEVGAVAIPSNRRLLLAKSPIELNC